MRWSLLLAAYAAGAVLWIAMFTAAATGAMQSIARLLTDSRGAMPWLIRSAVLLASAILIDALASRRKFWHGFLAPCFFHAGLLQVAALWLLANTRATPLSNVVRGLPVVLIEGLVLGGLTVLVSRARSSRLRRILIGGG